MEINDIKTLKISLASPETILSWSYGEVTKPETINYRRLRPEKDGLFCEAIFGPTKDYQCYCGKYKKVRFRGIKCDKCGVEVTQSRVRRERMGHIGLATPIAHIWYTRRSPSYLGLLLNISQRNLDRVLYYAQYIITDIDETARERALKRMDEEMAHEIESATAELRAELTELQERAASRAATLASLSESIRSELQATSDAQTETLMSEATRVRLLLESNLDKPATEDIHLAATDQVVLKAGEVVRREHLSAFNKTVQDALSDIDITRTTEADRLIAAAEDETQETEREESARMNEIQEAIESITIETELRFDQDRDDLTMLRPRQLLNETRYRELFERWPRVIKASMGAEAIYAITSKIDLEQLAQELRDEINISRSKQRRKKATRRLQIVESLRKAGNRPEWMILKVLPVIPPALRPMVQLDGGRFATSDLNDLYRRVVNRNNRLKHLIKLQAPDVIVRNEKRMLQEAVDSLIDNSRRGKAISLRGRRQLKSLSDMLKGKQGRFRRNLLGKRVDYSGRSVIVVGPHLKLHQCGLPKRMALELFRPFVMNKLVERNYAINVKGAKRLIEREEPPIWEVLEDIIKSRPVLLNRAPTLHRLGIQAFEPILVEGSAIQIHPLVCSAFNADFDGDQMAVHVPLSDEAVREARELMLSSHNLLRPANGEPEVGPSKDMVLGCYYLTIERPDMPGEGQVFSSFNEVQMAYELGKVHLHAKIKFVFQPTPRHKVRVIDTTVGRVLFNEILPSELWFVNRTLDKGGLKKLIGEGYRKLGIEGTAELVDAIKDIGFKYATLSGTTIALDDIKVPETKSEIIEEANERVAEIEHQFRRGLVTDSERYSKTVETWTEATDRVTAAVAKSLDPLSPIGIMVNSGSTKGGWNPIRQLAGMRGLMADPSGRIIALPIRSNFREGLTSLEYFISTHGARKGLADTALRTADAGYLTRRLVDVAQDVIIQEEDCGTTQGIKIVNDPKAPAGNLIERIVGRYAAAPVINPRTGEILVESNVMIDDDLAQEIDDAKVTEVMVRSPLTCSLSHGMCAHCYGRDLARGTEVAIGEAVGIVAAQSIGEPGTQLTLRTFHTGGVAGTSDITVGLPRVQELFEARIPKGQAIIAEISGSVHITAEDELRTVQLSASTLKRVAHSLPDEAVAVVEDGDQVNEGQLLARVDASGEEVMAKVAGRVSLEEGRIMVSYDDTETRTYDIPVTARLRVSEGQQVEAGDLITEGSKNPHEILSILGVDAVREYLVAEIQKVYRSQGVTINDKHIEVIVRQMQRRVRVVNQGDSDLLPGQWVDRFEFETINSELIESEREPATAEPVLLGITKAALNTDSFLSAASFQHTISVLASAAIEGREDKLHGLKESVIIGKLIPAGTGFKAADEESVPVTTLGNGFEDDSLDAEVLGEFANEFLTGGIIPDLGPIDPDFMGIEGGDDSEADDLVFSNEMDTGATDENDADGDYDYEETDSED
ncbi:MAG: DNA-directed RNA polymerase subunit beta' [Chloroflexi bacterium]|nr:DNA-directed RNA polymerase subunit beta' [Chloroflexota bacterium]